MDAGRLILIAASLAVIGAILALGAYARAKYRNEPRDDTEVSGWG